MKLADLFTDHNTDLDIVSVMGAVSFVAYITFAGYHLYFDKSFDPVNYSTGAAALIASVGGGYRLKSGQTPAKDSTQ